MQSPFDALPKFFQLTRWGGWLSPNGYKFYPLYFRTNDNILPYRVGIGRPPFDLDPKIWLLEKGFAQLEYDQSMLAGLSRDQAWRFIHWTVNAKKASLLQKKRIVVISRYVRDNYPSYMNRYQLSAFHSKKNKDGLEYDLVDLPINVRIKHFEQDLVRIRATENKAA